MRGHARRLSMIFGLTVNLQIEKTTLRLVRIQGRPERHLVLSRRYKEQENYLRTTCHGQVGDCWSYVL